MHKKQLSQKRGWKGQGMTEFALTLPILLVLLIGITEFGRLLFTYSAVVTAAREASRYGAAAGVNDSGILYYQDCDGIRATAIQIGSIANIPNASNATNGVVITYDRGPSTSAVGSGCPAPGPSTVILNKGDRIIVRVSTQFIPTSGLIPNLPVMTISSEVKRTVVTNVSVR